MNKALQYKNVGRRVAWKVRVLFLDPTSIYKRTKVNAFKRTQRISMLEMFPVRGKNCRCGCKKKMKGRRTAWASAECSKYATCVNAIICGHSATIKHFLQIYHEWKCIKCDDQIPQMDHILGVKHGGGGCWLSNFQLLCHKCHVCKTNIDFKHKTVKKIPK